MKQHSLKLLTVASLKLLTPSSLKLLTATLGVACSLCLSLFFGEACYARQGHDYIYNGEAQTDFNFNGYSLTNASNVVVTGTYVSAGFHTSTNGDIYTAGNVNVNSNFAVVGSFVSDNQLIISDGNGNLGVGSIHDTHLSGGQYNWSLPGTGGFYFDSQAFTSDGFGNLGMQSINSLYVVVTNALHVLAGGSITNNGGYNQSNLVTGAYGMFSTNAHWHWVDEHGTEYKSGTNGTLTIVQTNANSFLWSNGVLTMGSNNFVVISNGIVTAGNFVGGGAGLTGIPLSALPASVITNGGAMTVGPANSYVLFTNIAGNTIFFNTGVNGEGDFAFSFAGVQGWDLIGNRSTFQLQDDLGVHIAMSVAEGTEAAVFYGPVTAATFQSQHLLATNGIASSATNQYVWNTTGFTNVGTNNVRLFNLTGTNFMFSNSVSKVHFSLGIVTNNFCILQPGESLQGTNGTVAGIVDF
jgi:hypothetical protein